MGLVNDLKNQGFSQINTPISQNDFYCLVTNFREFDKQTSLKEKYSTHLMVDQDKDINYGYVPRKKSTGHDEKSYFHFHPRLLELNQLPNNKSYQKLLKTATQVFSPMENLIKQTIQELEVYEHINSENLLDEKGNPSMIMRILNYKTHPDTLMLAKSHTDLGVLTLAVYETHEGLEMIHNNSVYPIQYQKNKGNIFLGPKFKEYSKLKLPATKHQVRNFGDNRERSAVVFFIDELIDSELLNKYF